VWFNHLSPPCIHKRRSRGGMEESRLPFWRCLYKPDKCDLPLDPSHLQHSAVYICNTLPYTSRHTPTNTHLHPPSLFLQSIPPTLSLTHTLSCSLPCTHTQRLAPPPRLRHVTHLFVTHVFVPSHMKQARDIQVLYSDTQVLCSSISDAWTSHVTYVM